MPAKASSNPIQNSRPPSPASRLLQVPCNATWSDAVPRCMCRSWLASEGVLKPNTKLKTAFAGKPAPTGPVQCHDGPVQYHAVRVGAGLPAKASSNPIQNSRPPSPASRLLQVPCNATMLRCIPRCMCRSWLASEGVLKPDTKLKTAFAGKPAPAGPVQCHDGPLQYHAVCVGAGLPAKRPSSSI